MIIQLDLTSQSTLQWNFQIPEGEKSVIWELDLGLFDRLPFSLTDDAGLLTLQLGLKHFRETVYATYSDITEGFLIYRGSSQFGASQSDVMTYLLEILAELPIDKKVILHFESYALFDILSFLGHEGSEHFTLSFTESFPFNLKKEVAFSLPATSPGWEFLKTHLDALPLGCRIIPERLLTESWEGVETLITIPAGVSLQGKRKLLGFQAAGGIIIEL